MNSVRRQIGTTLSTETTPTGFRARFRIDPDFLLFPDHFPGFPVLPGVCLIQAVLLAGETWGGGRELHLATLKSAKFLGAVRPGDEVVIEGAAARHADGSVQIKADLSRAAERVARVSLSAGLTCASTGDTT